MSWPLVAWEIGRGIYSLGLLALGAVIVAGVPTTVRVVRDLTKALSAIAAGLHAQIIDRDELQQIRAAVEKLENGQTEDRRTLGEIKTLLERLSLSGVSGERTRHSGR